MWNQYYYFDLLKIRVGRARTTKNQFAFALAFTQHIMLSLLGSNEF